jgi:hypothetical protein
MSPDTAPAGAAANAMQYSILFVNNSGNAGSACVYQQNPNAGDPNVMSLAWFAKYAFPTTKISFQWTVDYDFIWSQTGTLVPGIIFMASQVWPADLSTANLVTLTCVGGAYTFKNQTAGPTPGNLYINQDETIPPKQAAVGIGMSGAGTFAVQAQPNWNLTFTPPAVPQYWITFGNFTQGEVIDTAGLTNAVQIQFPVNTYSMTATLNADNTWTVQPTYTMNARFLEARARRPGLVWGQEPGPDGE